MGKNVELISFCFKYLHSQLIPIPHQSLHTHSLFRATAV
jgi:hypothetical protein